MYNPNSTDGPASYDTSSDAPPTSAWPHRDFFKPYALPQGDFNYDELSAADQATYDQVRAHYDRHAAAITAAWSRGTYARAAHAQLKAAERAAGLQNIADVGVE